jgi:hypothetical protein
MENTSGNEESVKFDSSFDILASGIETNVLKAWKVVTMSEMFSLTLQRSLIQFLQHAL